MTKQHGEFDEIAKELRDFAVSRNWEQYHTPKNLSMALAGEAGELVAEFQWLTPEQSVRAALTSEKLEAIAMEIADVQIYLVRLADVLGINIPTSVRRKIEINGSRF